MVESLGLFGLFFICFLASSLYPLGSEAFVVLFLSLEYAWEKVFIVATIGNTLGALTTYGVGYLGDSYLLERYFKQAHSKIYRYKDKIQKYGYFYAFFSFLPFLGDVFMLGLGIYRYDFKKMLVCVTLGKALRYILLIFFYP